MPELLIGRYHNKRDGHAMPNTSFNNGTTAQDMCKSLQLDHQSQRLLHFVMCCCTYGDCCVVFPRVSSYLMSLCGVSPHV